MRKYIHRLLQGESRLTMGGLDSVVRPSVVGLVLYKKIEGTYKQYSQTLRRSSEDTERLKDILSAFGFERSDLKTMSFGVDTVYESYKEKDTYKQRFVGYKFVHLLKLEFESDNNRLGKILYALAECPLDPEFRIAYTVKDPEAAKNTLLGKAAKDANEKADVLSAAAGVTLKSIQSIDYSWGDQF